MSLWNAPLYCSFKSILPSACSSGLVPQLVSMVSQPNTVPINRALLFLALLSFIPIIAPLFSPFISDLAVHGTFSCYSMAGLTYTLKLRWTYLLTITLFICHLVWLLMVCVRLCGLSPYVWPIWLRAHRTMRCSSSIANPYLSHRLSISSPVSPLALLSLLFIISPYFSLFLFTALLAPQARYARCGAPRCAWCA